MCTNPLATNRREQYSGARTGSGAPGMNDKPRTQYAECYCGEQEFETNREDLISFNILHEGSILSYLIDMFCRS